MRPRRIDEYQEVSWSRDGVEGMRKKEGKTGREEMMKLTCRRAETDEKREAAAIRDLQRPG